MGTEINKSSKREELKKNNREQILKAALQVFGESGLDGSNVRDIIRTSELSPGTFYNYFQSKEEIFEVLLDEIIIDIHNKSRESWLKAWQGGYTSNSMKSAFEAFFNIFQNNPEYLYFFSKNQQYVRDLRYNGKINGIVSHLERDIEEAIKAGHLPPFPVKFITVALFGTVFEILADMIIHPGQISIPEVSETLSSFFKGGILALSLSTGTKEIGSNITSFLTLPLDILSKFIPPDDQVKEPKN